MNVGPSPRVLITGAQGFLGRYLVALYLGSAPSVKVFGIGRSPRFYDRFTHFVTWKDVRVPAPLPVELEESVSDSRYSYESIDIRDCSRLAESISKFKPTAI